MALTRFDCDVYINGNLGSATMTVPSSAVGDSSVKSDAAIQVTKTQHLIVAGTDFGIASDAAPAADVYKHLFTASGACTIRAFKGYLRDTGSSSDVKFNLYKVTAGTATLNSILSATINFTNADTDATPKAGSLSVTTLAAGDSLVAFMDWTSATGVLGPFAWAEIDEAAN